MDRKARDEALSRAGKEIAAWRIPEADAVLQALPALPQRSLLLAETALLRGETGKARTLALEAERNGARPRATREILRTLAAAGAKCFDETTPPIPVLHELKPAVQVRWLPVLFDEERFSEIIDTAAGVLAGDPPEGVGALAAYWDLQARYCLGEYETVVRRAEADARFASTPCRMVATTAALQLGDNQTAFRLFDLAHPTGEPPDFNPIHFNVTVRRRSVREAYSLYERDVTARGLREALPATYCGDAVVLCDAAGAVLIADFGVGDEIRHAAVYKELDARSTSLTVTCDPRLQQLLARSFPRLSFMPVKRWRRETRVGRYAERAAVGANIYCAMVLDDDSWQAVKRAPRIGGLAALIHTLESENATFRSESSPYLRADPKRIAEMATRMAPLRSGDTTLVGLCWRSILASTKRNARFTDIIAWHEVFLLKNIVFVNLQARLTSDERALIRASGASFVELDDIDLLDDFEAMAAVIATLDAVVARGNMAELSGALGVPTFFLATTYESSWREGINGLDWWSGSREILVPVIPGDKNSTLATLNKRLASFAAGDRRLNSTTEPR